MNSFKLILRLSAYALVAFIVVAFYFVFLSPRGLPNTISLSQYAPHYRTTAQSDEGSVYINVISFENINTSLTKALRVAGIAQDAPTALPPTLLNFVARRATTPTAFLIARTFKYSNQSFLDINEFRLSVQLDYRFSPSQRLTILLNRIHFTPTTTGVEDACIALFHRDAEELTLAQAATIAALAQSNELIHEPNQLLASRNQIIQQLLAQSLITADEAKQASAAPLAIQPATPTRPSEN